MRSMDELEKRYTLQTIHETHVQIAESLQAGWPGERFSASSIRRCCKANSITRRSNVSREGLDAAVPLFVMFTKGRLRLGCRRHLV